MPRGVGIDYFIQECVGFLDTSPAIFVCGFTGEENGEKKDRAFPLMINVLPVGTQIFSVNLAIWHMDCDTGLKGTVFPQ